MRDERGGTIVFVAIAMTGILSVAALAVDVGMMLTARSEAQRAADAGALAGAGSLIAAPTDANRARATAIQYGEANTVNGDGIDLLDEDVAVDLVQQRVTVTVRRAAGRGTGLATWFARVFGVDEVDVAARAAAVVEPAGAATCLKPWTIPDGWTDADGDQEYDGGEYYEATETGYGTDHRNGMAVDNGIDPSGTLYTNDRGRPMVMKPGNPDEAIVSSWYFPWDIPPVDGGPATGANRYRWNIANCNTSIITLGEEYMVENGNMVGPTRQGVGDLIALDPHAEWDPSAEHVTNSDYVPWEASPRIVNIPLYDPRFPVRPGKKPIVFNNIAAFFVEDMRGNDVIGRFMHLSGLGVGNGTPGSGLKFARLVE